MDAPPATEDSRPFVRVAGLMRAAGVHVPDILASDLAQGFLLLSDLGDATYLTSLTDANADGVFRRCDRCADQLAAFHGRWRFASV